MSSGHKRKQGMKVTGWLRTIHHCCWETHSYLCPLQGNYSSSQAWRLRPPSSYPSHTRENCCEVLWCCHLHQIQRHKREGITPTPSLYTNKRAVGAVEPGFSKLPNLSNRQRSGGKIMTEYDPPIVIINWQQKYTRAKGIDKLSVAV